jgi:hypothetical protein
VTLNGSGSSDPQGTTLTFGWSQTAGPAVVLTTSPSSAIATFTAPHVPAGSPAATLTFQLIVTNSVGLASGTSSVDITVNPAALLAPIVGAGAPQTVPSSTAGVTLSGTATDPNIPPQALNIQWTQTTGPAVALAGANTLTPTFTAPAVPAGQQPAVLTFVLSVINTGGANSVASTTVTVEPLGISVGITSVEYRTGTGRLTVNATASTISPTLVLTLTENAGLNPQPMQNLGGGLYQLVLVGVPQPTTVTVTAPPPTGGSATAPPPAFRIRQ